VAPLSHAQVVLDGYEENTGPVDVRLGVNFLACLCAATALVYGFFVPFPGCKTVLAVCAGGYFVLAGLSSALLFLVDRDVSFTARRAGKPDSGLAVTMSMGRFSDQYSVELQVLRNRKPVGESVSFEKSIAAYFDASGVMDVERVRADVTALIKSLPQAA
jgi:hypothetical protein